MTLALAGVDSRRFVPRYASRPFRSWFEHRAAAPLDGKPVEVPGCCGLAGNFRVERGHYEVSVPVAELDLLPAVRSAPPDATVLADGFSCRTQLADLADTPSVHLAQVLAARLAPTQTMRSS